MFSVLKNAGTKRDIVNVGLNYPRVSRKSFKSRPDWQRAQQKIYRSVNSGQGRVGAASGGRPGNSPENRKSLPSVRPARRQPTEDQCNPTATAANIAAMRLDDACPEWTTVGDLPSAETTSDGPGRCAHSYGADSH
jgi:hypothetical protein